MKLQGGRFPPTRHQSPVVLFRDAPRNEVRPTNPAILWVAGLPVQTLNITTLPLLFISYFFLTYPTIRQSYFPNPFPQVLVSSKLSGVVGLYRRFTPSYE